MPAEIKRNIGEIIGYTKILEKRYKNNRIYYLVECTECKKQREIRSDYIGCLCRSCSAKKRTPHIIDDLTGKQFGYLKVLYKSKKPNYWHCKCLRCGTEKDIFRGSLTQGQSKSCGCVRSWGETQLSYLLNKYNLSFKKEVIFDDLITDRNKHPRFDFGIYVNDNLFCLIEFDGRQHFYYDNNWKQSLEDYNRLKEIDEMKDKYCSEHNIKLYRFNNKTNLEEAIINIAKGINRGTI